MAEHPYRGYRIEDGREPHRAPDRSADERSWSASNNDPLAELARLIGQDDPFASAAPRSAQEPRPGRGAPTGYDEPAAYNEEPEAPDWLTRPGEARSFDAGNLDYGAHESERQSPRRGHSEAMFSTARDRRDREWEEVAIGDGQYDSNYDASFEDARFGARSGGYGSRSNQDTIDVYPDDQSYDSELAEEERYIQPKQRRRGGLMTVVAVVGLAILGTAGALGYRAYVGSGTNAKPPVILADAGPNKVIPTPPPAGEGGQNKAIYDRLPERPQGERVVVREEQPVERPAMPRADLPAAPSAIPQMAAAQPPAPSPMANEPKRVRTITIRPDQSGAADAPPVRTAAQAPASSSAVRTVTTRSSAQPTSPSAPLSIAPQPTESAPTRTAALPSATRAAAIPEGSYMVQLTSQKTENEAQASYRALQAKYPNVLGSRQPVIKRADLGEKGVYYRAQIGPFASADQANEFCGTLKSAGGQCIVQRN